MGIKDKFFTGGKGTVEEGRSRGNRGKDRQAGAADRT